jgi:cytochrome c biogenesis protein CcdA
VSDTTVLTVATAAEASPAGIFLLLAICSIGVAVTCYVVGWLAAWADRRWPAANRYQREPEQ